MPPVGRVIPRMGPIRATVFPRFQWRATSSGAKQNSGPDVCCTGAHCRPTLQRLLKKHAADNAVDGMLTASSVTETDSASLRTLPTRFNPRQVPLAKRNYSAAPSASLTAENAPVSYPARIFDTKFSTIAMCASSSRTPTRLNCATE